jgi:putative spermidine/putrescine transport system permease protein
MPIFSKQPLNWRILDALEKLAALLWPKALRPWTGYLLLLPALLLVLILVIGLVYIADDSLHKLDLATYRLLPEYSLANYFTVLDRPVYLKVLGRSLAAALIVSVITLILAFPYAYVMVRTASSFLRKFLLISLFLPFFIGQVVRAYGWLIILGQQGILNTALSALGFDGVDLIYNYWAVILGLVQYMLPFAVLLLAPAITAIPADIELASEGLGAHWLNTFRHVVIPLAKPGIIGAFVVVFTLTLTDFAMPEILGGGTNDFIANAIYDSFFQISDPGLGAALSMILVTLGSVLVALIFRWAGTGTLGFADDQSTR